ncbi:MAG: c-type cytochrome, partial [Gemmatimonadetes bacterium]|nr:c-type cytochrome [Gemmatimonadota bacterium]
MRPLGVVLAVLAVGGTLSSGTRQLGTPPAQVTPSSPRARGAREPQWLSPFAAAKAERLIRERLPCLGCHELDGDGGRMAPDLTDVGSRRSAVFIESMIRDPQRTVPGTVMPKTPMTEQLLLLLVDDLRSRGGPPKSQDPVTENAKIPVMSRDAGTLYARFCASCHGSDGDGAGFNAAALPVQPTDHTDSAHMSTRPDDSLYDTIHAGGYIMNLSNRMPGFGYTLSHTEIRGLVKY